MGPNMSTQPNLLIVSKIIMYKLNSLVKLQFRQGMVTLSNNNRFNCKTKMIKICRFKVSKLTHSIFRKVPQEVSFQHVIQVVHCLHQRCSHHVKASRKKDKFRKMAQFSNHKSLKNPKKCTLKLKFKDRKILNVLNQSSRFKNSNLNTLKTRIKRVHHATQVKAQIASKIKMIKIRFSPAIIIL